MNLVSRREAALVRQLANRQPDETVEDARVHRIFWPPTADGDEPVCFVEASGRSSCRECGERIEKGERIVAFGFDPYAEGGETGGRSWARLARAYLHADPCTTYPEEGTE